VKRSLALLAGLLLASPAWSALPEGGIPTRVSIGPLEPDPHLGDRLTYRGWVALPPRTGLRWLAPDRTGDLRWGPIRSGRAPLKVRPEGGEPWPAESIWVEAPLQIFEIGMVAVPGMEFEIIADDGTPRRGRLRLSHVKVVATVPADDSTTQLRPPRGPIAAPWWELVPWRLVAVVAVVLALAIAVFRFFRRKKPVPKPVVAAAPVKRRDPAAEALLRLSALRRRNLPEEGRFSEHAFELGQILRRFLEAVVHVPRPGDTTPELVRHLESGGFAPDDLKRLSGLLQRWDGIKFARLPSDLDEATACEESVRALVLRHGRPQKAEVA